MRDVLAVEDDRVVLATTVRLCAFEGVQVDVADSVGGALAMLAEDDYRLVLVDLKLPGRSGFELLDVMAESHRSTPVVMISGYATLENILESLRRGAFDFLPKPFDLEELLGVVRRGLRYRGPQARGAGCDPAAGKRYFLGRHSWAVLDAEGTATLGAAESFHGLLAGARLLELPEAGDHASQGRTLARLAGNDESHRVRAALSGVVVAVNRELAESPELIDQAPFDSGWLARIVPLDPENELMALTSRPPGGDPTTGG